MPLRLTPALLRTLGFLVVEALVVIQTPWPMLLLVLGPLALKLVMALLRPLSSPQPLIASAVSAVGCSAPVQLSLRHLTRWAAIRVMKPAVRAGAAAVVDVAPPPLVHAVQRRHREAACDV